MSHEKLARAGAVAALALAAALLAGCTHASGSHGSTPGPTARHTVVPTGSVTVGCDVARAVESDNPPPGADDLVFGPLVLRGLAHGYHADPAPEADADGVTFFKIGTEMTPGAIATVSIDSAARSYAGILTERGPSVGYSSVTYTSCPVATQPLDVWWVGGFTLVGRQSACVPLTIQVAGETTKHHVVLPIDSTSCAGTTATN